MKVEIGCYPDSKSKARRTIRVKIDVWDTWSLNHTLALIIAPALRKFKKANNGVPGSLMDLSHHETMEWNSAAFKKAERKASDRADKEWDRILDVMIWSFEEVAADNPSEPIITKFKDKRQWRRRADAYHKRLDEGFALFGKWYGALWT